jgi:hypothetical protein
MGVGWFHRLSNNEIFEMQSKDTRGLCHSGCAGLLPIFRPYTTTPMPCSPLPLANLICLLNPSTSVPLSLYPRDSSLITRRLRALQLVFGYLRLVLLRISGQRTAVIEGMNLAYHEGWVRVTIRLGSWKRLSTSKISEPFIPVPLPAKGRSELLEIFGSDPDSGFDVFLSPNGHLVIRGTWEREPCIVHYGGGSQARDAVLRHASGARRARVALIEIRHLIPQSCFELDGECAYVYGERQVLGAMLNPATLSNINLAHSIFDAIAPLQQIHESAAKVGRTFTTSFIDDELIRVPARIPNASTEIRLAIDCLRRWTKRRRPLSVPTHGDYAPRNLFFLDRQLSGVMDWEWFWENGIAGFDALTLILEIEASKRRSSIVAVLTGFLNSTLSSDEFASRIALIRTRFLLSVDDLYHLAILLWLRILWVGCVMTVPAGPRWINRMLEPISGLSCLSAGSFAGKKRATGI